ncbi:heterokaryon incompatibility protein-domain-containing protein [Xylaria venustula]|nr:heterokaryon incompatibility protein-domain-containing protein [Xylaria venustula]
MLNKRKRPRARAPANVSKRPKPTTTASSSQPISPIAKIDFNVLCTVCESLFPRTNKVSMSKFHEFHTPSKLIQSATNDCHFCALLVNEMRNKGNSPENIKTLNSLTVETRFYEGYGISILLFNENRHSSLATVDLTFENGENVKRLKPIRSTHTGSEESWTQVEKWFNRCTETHASCHIHTVAIPIGKCPTRLIHVEATSISGVRLCETSNLTCLDLTYATLSHCWGGVVPIRLLGENYDQFHEEIPWDKLPQTFKDAIQVTRNLNIRYLWIDSLCIIQNNSDDWVKEASDMGQVYRNSHLNIAAAAALDAACGLFYPRSMFSIVPCTISIRRRGELKRIATSYSSELESYSNDLVLLNRAWVFQEWLLSPRILVFGKKELYWICENLVEYEMATPTILEGSETNFPPLQRIPWVSLRKDWSKTYTAGRHGSWETWQEVVRLYSSMKLTNFSDKLVAMTGLASHLGSKWNETTYLAGLWLHRLRRDLLWRTEKPQPRPQQSCSLPSWSWASLDSAVIPAKENKISESLVEVVGASTQLSNSLNPYGAVTGGIIQLKAPLIRTIISKIPNSRKWTVNLYDPKEETEEAIAGEPLPVRATVESTVYWDDKAMSEMIQSAAVTLVPFEISSFESTLNLQGLILDRTYCKNGQYRRLGYFSIRDSWSEYKFDANRLLSQYLPSRTDSQGSHSSQSSTGSQETTSSVRRRGRTVTALEIKAIFETAHREEEALQGSQSEQTQKIRKRMLGKKYTEQDEDPDNAESEGDALGNEAIDMTLVNRYTDELDPVNYPNINSFLSLILIRFELSQEHGHLQNELYQLCHGQGYFTIEII